MSLKLSSLILKVKISISLGNILGSIPFPLCYLEILSKIKFLIDCLLAWLLDRFGIKHLSTVSFLRYITLRNITELVYGFSVAFGNHLP